MNNDDVKQANKKFIDETFKRRYKNFKDKRIRGHIAHTDSRVKTDIALFGLPVPCKITRDGCGVEASPIIFKRFPHQQPQVTPI
jgi:hypothetical protein